MNKRKIRDSIRLSGALLCAFLYVPHMLSYFLLGKKRLFDSDIARLKKQVNISLPNWLAVLYFLHNNNYYRTVFYHRIGPVLALLIGWWRPRNKYFTIANKTRIGGAFYLLTHTLQCLMQSR